MQACIYRLTCKQANSYLRVTRGYNGQDLKLDASRHTLRRYVIRREKPVHCVTADIPCQLKSTGPGEEEALLQIQRKSITDVCLFNVGIVQMKLIWILKIINVD